LETFSKNQKVVLPLLEEHEIDLFLKREDQIHPLISGNKYRKLKYNLIKAKEDGHKTLLTFGGAYSNHISAVAFAGKKYGFHTIGVIRGDELKDKLDEILKTNPTLRLAAEHGMKFEFVSRSDYRLKNSSDFIEQLRSKHEDFYLIPEGGTNDLAIKGCEEILNPDDNFFDVICVAVGTGGTISGIINSAGKDQFIMGFPALKGDFLEKEIKKIIRPNKNWKLINDYHFGGYAKVNEELVDFINNFKFDTSIALDPIYTGKMMYGILDMIQLGRFDRGTKILAIHTGGLQGIQGMNIKLEHKKLPIIR
jgi:1-aminocyclopropane-1-carboxylate deaminase